jgi:hypothetical protein
MEEGGNQLEKTAKLWIVSSDVGKPMSDHKPVRGIVCGAIIALALWIVIAAVVIAV